MICALRTSLIIWLVDFASEMTNWFSSSEPLLVSKVCLWFDFTNRFVRTHFIFSCHLSLTDTTVHLHLFALFGHLECDRYWRRRLHCPRHFLPALYVPHHHQKHLISMRKDTPTFEPLAIRFAAFPQPNISPTTFLMELATFEHIKISHFDSQTQMIITSNIASTLSIFILKHFFLC